ncbi:hypothetical protein BC941DRAFT_465738 [Chlamydoabsidia padenii]|nr:hypothetical protein BC941DRAFT_477150 [Chlamydoabsidia padenii]KAI8343576.1 hypothetical protein BC941DRAFT_465738 [Chlamydoabsidia padenii]
MDERQYNQIKHYQRHLQYPDDATESEKRYLRRNSSQFIFENGSLYHFDSNADMTLRSIWKEMNEQDEWLQGSGPPFSRLGHDEDDILQAIFGIPSLMAWADQI